MHSIYKLSWYFINFPDRVPILCDYFWKLWGKRIQDRDNLEMLIVTNRDNILVHCYILWYVLLSDTDVQYRMEQEVGQILCCACFTGTCWRFTCFILYINSLVKYIPQYIQLTGVASLTAWESKPASTGTFLQVTWVKSQTKDCQTLKQIL